MQRIKMIIMKNIKNFQRKYTFLIIQKQPDILKIYTQEWALCFLKNLILCKQNTNNIYEAAIRVLKD